jgi:hypothetical protein
LSHPSRHSLLVGNHDAVWAFFVIERLAIFHKREDELVIGERFVDLWQRDYDTVSVSSFYQ